MNTSLFAYKLPGTLVKQEFGQLEKIVNVCYLSNVFSKLIISLSMLMSLSKFENAVSFRFLLCNEHSLRFEIDTAINVIGSTIYN